MEDNRIKETLKVWNRNGAITKAWNDVDKNVSEKWKKYVTGELKPLDVPNIEKYGL